MLSFTAVHPDLLVLICVLVFARYICMKAHGKNAYCIQFMRIDAYTEKPHICSLCCLYGIQIHYADWKNICSHALIWAPIRMKPHRNHADLENISAYSDIPKAYMRISAWNHICGICMASYIIWAMCRLELSDKLSYCSFWGQKLGKNCACCDICKFAIKVHKRFEIG